MAQGSYRGSVDRDRHAEPESGVARLQVRTRLRTEQDASDGPDGQTCSDWSLDYAMVMQDGVWHIDKAQSHGVDPTAC